MHHTCACPLGLDGLPVCPDGPECAAGYLHEYPIGLASHSPPPHHIPSVRISHPDNDAPKPAGRQPAIDPLRAKPPQPKSRPRIEETADRVALARNANFGSVSDASCNKEDENEGRSSSTGTASGDNTNTHSRGSKAPMKTVVNRSLSISTSTSAGEITNSSWKSSSMTLDSQTTMSPGELSGRDAKFKQSVAWSYSSPKSTPESLYGDKIPVSGCTDTPPRDRRPRGQRQTAKDGKTVLGCSQCLFDPRLQVTPCGCLICIDCGGRFWSTISSTNIEVFCGCGEVCILRRRHLTLLTNAQRAQRVASMINLDPVNASQTVMASSLHTPSDVRSPASMGASPSSPTAAVHLCPTPGSGFQPSPLKMDSMLPFLPTIPPIQLASSRPAAQAKPARMNKLLAMDAETAVRNAPFVDLGRNSLPQNWSCVKIGNVISLPYSGAIILTPQT